MTPRYLVDTSAYSAFLRGHDQVTECIQKSDLLALNPVILGELLAGFRDGSRLEENRAWLEQFLSSSRVRVLDVDRETADRYSEIHVYLKRRGTPIPANDVWIAASAMQHGLYVLTTDPHFERVVQVSVELCPASTVG